MLGYRIEAKFWELAKRHRLRYARQWGPPRVTVQALLNFVAVNAKRRQAPEAQHPAAPSRFQTDGGGGMGRTRRAGREAEHKSESKAISEGRAARTARPPGAARS